MHMSGTTYKVLGGLMSAAVQAVGMTSGVSKGRAALAALLTGFALAGCGGGSGDASANSSPRALPQSVPTVTVLTVNKLGSGTVTSNPAGIDCGSDCSQEFTPNSVIALKATPATGYDITGWTGAGVSCGATTTCTVTLADSVAVQAIFSAKQAVKYDLELHVTGAGTVVSSAAGVNCSATLCTYSFDTGTSVTLAATPVNGYTFTGWSGYPSCTTSTSCTVPMTAVRSLTATFTKVIPKYTLSVTKSGNGTVAALTGIICGSTCSYAYDDGTSVTLAASPDAGYKFSGWSGACAGTGACTVSMSAARSVSASFTVIPPTTHALNVALGGLGTVTSSPIGISCGSDCSESYNEGTAVTLAAAPSAGYSFSGWGGDCSGTAATCTVTMSAARTVTASYSVISYQLSVSTQGSGTVTSNMGGISCGATCSKSYTPGSAVILTATPSTGYVLSAWSGGGCTGSSPTCTVTVSATTSVKATFVEQQYALSVTTSVGGMVGSSPTGISCAASSNCSGNFGSGVPVSLTATPATGYSFSAWGGACTGAGTCSVTMSAAKAVTATFAATPKTTTLVTDKRVIAIPTNSGAYPAKGSTTTDPITGFQITRVADKSELINDYGGTKSGMSLVVYARFTAVNTTGEYALVHGDNSTSAWIYRVSDNKMMTVVKFHPSLPPADSASLGEVNELRWDYSGAHPYRLYFVGNSISSESVGAENTVMSFYYTEFDPATGKQLQPVLIHDFSKDFPTFTSNYIFNDVEGDSSNDSRYWAWMVQGSTSASGYRPSAIFVYDKQTDTVVSSLQRSCTGSLVPCKVVNSATIPAPYIPRPNMVEMSPLGTRVVVDWGRIAQNYGRDADINTVTDGPKAFLKDFSDPIRIGADETHSGWAWGPNGEEMFVSQNNRNDWIEAVDVANATTANCKLIPGMTSNDYSCGVKIYPYSELDGGSWSLGMHFGKVYDRTKKGYAFMNTYDTTYGSWGKNQNLFIEINDYNTRASKLVRFGSSYNLYYDYRSEGSGALDFQGNSIWTTGNWGFKDGRGDVFKVQLPTGWFSSLP